MPGGGAHLYSEDTSNLRNDGFRKTKTAGISTEEGYCESGNRGLLCYLGLEVDRRPGEDMTLCFLGLEENRSPGEDTTQVCKEAMKDHFSVFGAKMKYKRGSRKS